MPCMVYFHHHNKSTANTYNSTKIVSDIVLHEVQCQMLWIDPKISQPSFKAAAKSLIVLINWMSRLSFTKTVLCITQYIM